MATWQIALIREQGVEFAAVCVSDAVLDSAQQRDELINWWTFELGRPVVLLGARRHRTFGRQDLVTFLRNVHPSRLPWRQLTIAA